MRSLRKLVFITMLVAGIAMLGACATTQPRVENGSNFATAGIAYIDALPAVFEESFKLTVAANTHQLLLSREDLDEDSRIGRLSESDDLLEERLIVLQELRRHSLLLRSYFLALKALAASDNASTINAAADGVVAGLGEVRISITEKPTNGASITELMGPAISMAVGAFQNISLQKELAAHGASIERELALQRAMIDALVDDMTDNAKLIVQIEELNPVFDEYVSANAVSSAWGDKRIAAFKRAVSLESYDDIRKAAANMHSTWVALVQSGDNEITLDLLVQDIENFLAVVRGFKSKE